MPSRILRDSIVNSESVASLPADVQDRLHRYLLHADDYGCFRLQPAVIKGAIFPLRPDVTEERIDADLKAYASVDIVRIWKAEDGKTYCGFPNWNRHQRPAKPGTRHKTPAPPWETGSIPAPPGTSGKSPEEEGDAGKIPVSRARAHSQSQVWGMGDESQSQGKASSTDKPSTTVPDAIHPPPLMLLPPTNAEAPRSTSRKQMKPITAEQRACMDAIRSRIETEYLRETGEPFDWNAGGGKENASVRNLAASCRNDVAAVMRLIDVSMEKGKSGDKLFAERGLSPSFIVSQINTLRVLARQQEAQSRAASAPTSAEVLGKLAEASRQVAEEKAAGFKPSSPWTRKAENRDGR